jgi:hypothetical protein
MKKLLLKIILFVVPITVLIAVFEIHLNKVPTTVGEKKQRLEAGLSDWETMLLGSSHAYRGLNPHYFKSRAINAAAPGQSLYFDSAILLRYIPQMPKLKTVVFACSFLSFEYSTSDNPEYWRKFFYSLYYGMSEKNDIPIWDLRNISWFAFYGNRASFDHFRQGFSGNFPGPVDELGWIGGMKNTETEFNALGKEGARRRMDYQLSILNRSFISRNRAALETALKELKERNIRAVIVAIPVSSEYFERIPPDKLAAMQVEIKGLVQKYGISYFDHMNDSRFLAEDFLNNDHLNERGAAKLSGILEKELSHGWRHRV